MKGFEIQVNNTDPGEGAYRERKKTGSLYGLRNVYKQLQADDQWFKLNALVRGKNVQIRLNGVLVVDYTEPTPPVIPPGQETGRYLDKGTFALQCHNDGSRALFRSVRVRPLPDDTPTPAGPAPVADDVFKQIIALGAHNYPMVDYHVHLKEGLTLEQALEKSRRDGIDYGIAVNCGKGFPIENDDGARAFFESMKGQPVFIAMQAEGREWMQMFTRRAVALFDYIFTDSMTWTDNHGKRMRLWIPEEVGTIADPQEFMDTLVDRAVGILEREPIDIYANPTFLPDVHRQGLRPAVDRSAHEKGGGRGGQEPGGHRDQQPLQAAQPRLHPHGQAGRLQVHVRHQQHRPRRSGPLRVRPAHGGGMQPRVAGFLRPGRLVAQGLRAQRGGAESGITPTSISAVAPRWR